MMVTTSVPRLWPDATVVCVASGPSVTAADVESVRGKAKVIVVNTSYQLAPWADCLYAADARWWEWHHGAKDFAGMKYSLSDNAAKWPGVVVLKNTGFQGLERDPSGLRTGKNSGYQAINLAVHLGARRILLLGYDLQRGPNGAEHWHQDHPNRSRSNYDLLRRYYPTLVEPLKALNIEIVNCTRRTALKCFPCQSLESVLAESVASMNRWMRGVPYAS